MCRHHPVPLYVEPGRAAPIERRPAFVFRDLGAWVRCAKCDLTGTVRHLGRGVTWHTPGTVGHASRERTFAKAREWNTAGTSPSEAGTP